MKRMVFISDLHCGHETGLTPPDWNPIYSTHSEKYPLYRMRRAMWKFYADTMEELQPIHALCINGDGTDGKGKKSGSTELLTADRIEQADMVIAAADEAKAEKVVVTSGTPYHTGNSEDFEKLVAKHYGVPLDHRVWPEINGVVFDVRHAIGRSSIPHGRMTPLAREKLWSGLMAEHGEYPRAHVVVRSHTHYFAYCGGYGWLGIITPSLQGHTKFGESQVSGTVDFGIVWFDIPESGKDWTWHYKIMKVREGQRRARKL